VQRDLDLVLANGADSVVLGVLHEDGTVDQSRCRALMMQQCEGSASHEYLPER
jgi:copper homeostasis protein CutC